MKIWFIGADLELSTLCTEEQPLHFLQAMYQIDNTLRLQQKKKKRKKDSPAFKATSVIFLFHFKNGKNIV